MEKNVSTSNKLIAEFMGAVYVNDAPEDYPNGYYHWDGPMHLDEFEYHSSWEWLMMVVEKINSMFHSITIEGNGEDDKCEVLCYDDTNELDLIITEYGISLKEATYNAVVKFIEWHSKIAKIAP